MMKKLREAHVLLEIFIVSNFAFLSVDIYLAHSAYLQQFAMPNFFFFVTTAYNILRHRGVPIGKLDFLGPISMG